MIYPGTKPNVVDEFFHAKSGLMFCVIRAPDGLQIPLPLPGIHKIKFTIPPSAVVGDEVNLLLVGKGQSATIIGHQSAGDGMMFEVLVQAT